ncbi:MAG: hypothetical protein RSC08_05615, partial [Oscillospiraceae bacterium]
GQLGNGGITGTQGSAASSYRAMSVASGTNSAFASVFLMEQKQTGYVEVVNNSAKLEPQNKRDLTGTLYGWGQVNQTFSTKPAGELMVTVPELITNTAAVTYDSYRGHVMMMGGGSAFYTVDEKGNLVLSGGNNNYGELGNGSIKTSNNQNGGFVYRSQADKDQTPAVTLNSVLSVDAATGGYHTVAVDATGKVWGFGQNNMSQLGSQNLATPYNTFAGAANSTFSVDGKTYTASLVLASDKAKAGLTTSLDATFDLNTNYTVSQGFNLLTQAPAIYHDARAARAGGYTVTYTSMDPTVATVDNTTGIVTAAGYGFTYILVSIAKDTTTRELQFKVEVVTPYTNGFYTYEPATQTYKLEATATADAYAKVVVGEDYTLALKADGTVWAWGRNTWGQLGVGAGSVGGVESAPQQLTFTKIIGYDRPAGVSASYVKHYTEVAYQRALSAATNPVDLAVLRQYTPVYSALQGYRKPAELLTAGYPETYTEAGYEKACADAELLGSGIDPTTNETGKQMLKNLARYTEIRADKNRKIVKIAAGMDFAMALDDEGTLYTWGRNNVGQLGNGTKAQVVGGKEPYVPTPVAVDYFRRLRNSADPEATLEIVDIYAGAYAASANLPSESYAMATTATGDLFVWGTNLSSQIHTVDGKNTAPVYAPVSDVVDLSAASFGAARALNQEGRLATWSTEDLSSNAVTHTVHGITPRVVDLDAGKGNTFALTKNGEVWSTGSNANGQLGNGTNADVSGFQKNSALSDVKYLTGGQSTVALKGDDTILATGTNQAGELGSGTQTDSNVFAPVHAGDTAGANATDAQRNAPMKNVVWADTGMGLALDDPDAGKRTETGLSSAIITDGSVFTWGNNDYGQMGNK